MRLRPQEKYKISMIRILFSSGIELSRVYTWPLWFHQWEWMSLGYQWWLTSDSLSLSLSSPLLLSLSLSVPCKSLLLTNTFLPIWAATYFQKVTLGCFLNGFAKNIFCKVLSPSTRDALPDTIVNNKHDFYNFNITRWCGKLGEVLILLRDVLRGVDLS